MSVRHFGLACALAALSASGVPAQDNSLYFSPDLVAEFTAPTAFEGLYAGVVFGPISARKNNFNVGGAEIRPEVGAAIGWNQPIAPGVVVGGELQATIATDFAGSSYVRAMALARLGFAAGDRTLIYGLAGLGRMGEGWAFEAGLGAEVMVTDSMGLRTEAVGIGQLGPVPNGNNIPGISAVRITGGALWHLGATAPLGPLASGPVTDFDGPYAGLSVGTALNYPYNFFIDYGNGGHLSRFAMSGIAGWNYALNDTFRVGVEGQLGTSWDTSGDVGVDALALAHTGVVPMEGLMPYVAAGLGVLENKPAYVLGGGVEYALWRDATIRGEWLALGELSSTPTVSGFSAHKVTVGALWHFD